MAKSKSKYYTEQILHSIKIDNLKCLKDVEINLDSSRMVAILAPNGSGKSTILHALACAYKRPVNPPDKEDRFSKYFRPTSNTDWKDSSFSICYSCKVNGVSVDKVIRSFVKNSDRWCRYESRPGRYVKYIGIRTCVPLIESERESTRTLKFSKQELSTDNDKKVKRYACEVMNRKYEDYFVQQTSEKKYISVRSNRINYSSLSMGAGEQRIFYILKEVINAPKYGLILIDEIDLLLHEDALSRLLDILKLLSKDNKLQIIFTTHAHSILSKNYIAFRHLLQVKGRTICFDKTYPEFLRALTGKNEKLLKISVEDSLAQAIVAKVCKEESIGKYVELNKFGVWTNGISAACGVILNSLPSDKYLFVLDGDVETRLDENIEETIKRVIGGSDAKSQQSRRDAFNLITRFSLPPATAPEEYFRSLVLELDEDKLNNEENDVYGALSHYEGSSDHHDYFIRAIEELGETVEMGYNRVVGLLSKTEAWAQITKNVRDWVSERKESLIL